MQHCYTKIEVGHYLPTYLLLSTLTKIVKGLSFCRWVVWLYSWNVNVFSFSIAAASHLLVFFCDESDYVLDLAAMLPYWLVVLDRRKIYP